MNWYTLVLLVLLIGTVIVEYRAKMHPSAESQENRKRLFSWWLIASTLLLVVSAGEWMFTIFVFLLILFATYEAVQLFGLRWGASIILPTLMFMGINYSLISWLSPHHVSLLAPFAFFLLLRGFGVWTRNPTYRKLFFFLFLITSIQSLVMISDLGPLLGGTSQSLLFSLFFLTSINDIGQYVFGKWLGTHKLAPAISPQKTIEGALGGILTTAVCGFLILPWSVDISAVYGFFVGATLGLLGICGDLNISALKRAAGRKHSGNLIPGLGGILDRIDSLTLTAPAFGIFLLVIK
jgi:phosphatidate cytidylyltransferase